MMDILTNTLAFIFALGVIIFVHEFGHLIVAKLFDTRVLTFSLGFGTRLWGFKRGETDYRVSLVPLGGYVKLGGEMPEDSTGDPREFLSKPRWQRVLIYLAGPAMNVVLSILLIAIVFMVGIEVPDAASIEPVVGQVVEGSSAAGAGVAPGDRILAIGGEEVESWDDVVMALMTAPDRPVDLRLRRGEEEIAATVTPREIPDYGVGDSAGILPRVLPQITRLIGGSPAEEAGFRPGDELLAVDGQPIGSTQSFVEHIEQRPGETVRVEVMREGRRLVLPVVPGRQGEVGKIGAEIGVLQRYGPVEAFAKSARHNVEIVQRTFAVLGKIVTRELSAKGALAGPIEIAAYSGAAVRTGFKYLLYLMGFISISIAILNLLPIPILDGGQILILLVESVMRRDLSLRLKELISQVGFVLIMLLMLVVIYFDLSKNLPDLLSG